MAKVLKLNEFHNVSGSGEMKAAVEPTIVKGAVSAGSVEPNTAATVSAGLQNGENLAAPTKDKGVNWILIGGLAIGGILLFKYLKRG